jgi:hypothetical protein
MIPQDRTMAITEYTIAFHTVMLTAAVSSSRLGIPPGYTSGAM